MKDGKTQAAWMVQNVREGLKISDERFHREYFLPLVGCYDAGDFLRAAITSTIERVQYRASVEVVDFLRAMVDNRKATSTPEITAVLDDLVLSVQDVFPPKR